MIKVENLFKSYSKSDRTSFKVLDGISFTVGDGEFCCILGPSGCGKTTLLNIIASLTSFDSGKVAIGNKSAISNSIKIGYVFQKSTLLRWKTVRGNLEFVLKCQEIPKIQWEERITHYLQLVGLRQFINEYPSSLSVGMEKRLALARGLIIKPDLILMDEPFSSVDEITARELRNDLIEIWRNEKTTIVFVTHNILEAIYLGDRIILLSDIPSKVLNDYSVEIPRNERLNNPESLKLHRDIVLNMENYGKLESAKHGG